MTARITNQWMRQGYSMLVGAALIASCAPEPSARAPQSMAASATAAMELHAADSIAATPEAGLPVIAAAVSDFPVSGILQPDQGVGLGDYMWEAAGVPDGRTTIVVDLAAQILYVYRGGIEIGRAAILYGADDKPTPTGTFPILEKDADHVSNLYDAPMPYMLRLTWDGIAIHGSTVEYGSATHGCVGVPDEFAELLFAEAGIGDRVLVTNGWMPEVYGASA